MGFKNVITFETCLSENDIVKLDRLNQALNCLDEIYRAYKSGVVAGETYPNRGYSTVLEELKRSNFFNN